MAIVHVGIDLAKKPKMNATISIGLLAKQTGCTVPTIRHFEEIGLLLGSTVSARSSD